MSDRRFLGILLARGDVIGGLAERRERPPANVNLDNTPPIEIKLKLSHVTRTCVYVTTQMDQSGDY